MPLAKYMQSKNYVNYSSSGGSTELIRMPHLLRRLRTAAQCLV